MMGKDGKIYIHKPEVKKFHHSSFFAGGDVAGVGKIEIVNAVLGRIDNDSG